MGLCVHQPEMDTQLDPGGREMTHSMECASADVPWHDLTEHDERGMEAGMLTWGRSYHNPGIH